MPLEGPSAPAVAARTGTDRPIVRVDWFLASASRAPLYHELLKLPNSMAELESRLFVKIDDDRKNGRTARVGLTGSTVTPQGRVIERHDSAFGAMWKTFDFADRQDVRTRPLGPGDGPHDFRSGGGEALFELPNGMIGFFVASADGSRLDSAPTALLRDPKRPTVPVANGLSCLGCHATGPIAATDEVRPSLAKSNLPDDVLDAADDLYPPADRLAELVRNDSARYARAVAETGAFAGPTEIIATLAREFEADVTPETAAIEAGLAPDPLKSLIGRTPRLSQALRPLTQGQSVRREAFSEAFPALVEARFPDASRRQTIVERRPSAPGPQPQPQPQPPRNDPAPAPKMAANPPKGTKPGAKGRYPAERLDAIPENVRSDDREGFRDVAPEGALLVGLRVRYGEFLGRAKVGAVQPIYRKGTKETRGEWHGEAQGGEGEAIARPGYAIGALNTRTGLLVDGCQVVFMRIKGDRLIPEDSYNAPWLGDTQNGGPNFILGEGRIAVGIHGRAGRELNSLGLLLLK